VTCFCIDVYNKALFLGAIVQSIAHMLQDQLMAEITDTSSDYQVVVRAIQHVELLKAEGLAAAKGAKPLSAFAHSQRDFLQQRLRIIVERHIETVTSVAAMEVRLLLL
jgi:hypothetical protein